MLDPQNCVFCENQGREEEMELECGKVGGVDDKSKLKRILLKVIGELDSIKYKTELIKLCFIIDYTYCKKFGQKRGPTTVDYVRYNYGPYSEAFIEALEELKNEGKITEVVLSFGVGYGKNQDNEEEEVEAEEDRIIKEVVDSYGTKSLRELKGYIYDLTEFKNSKFGKSIDLGQGEFG